MAAITYDDGSKQPVPYNHKFIENNDNGEFTISIPLAEIISVPKKKIEIRSLRVTGNEIA